MPHPLDTMSRQKKFLTIYKTSKDAAEAANEAWPELPPRRRAQMAKRTLTQPDVARLLDKHSLGVGKLMKRHQELLSAKKTININGIVDEVPNDEVRLKAVEMGYKLHKLLSPRETETTNNTVNIQLDPQRLEEVARRLEAVNAKMLPDRANVTDADII